jgi:hypothetical protein
MTRLINISGQKFNRLIALKIFDSKPSGVRWLCKCECGGETIVNSLKLRTGKTTSCGCFKKENPPRLLHGCANKSPTYRTWKEMRQRCKNPNATQYKWYGAKGINIDSKWDEYANFVLDMGERPKGKTIDRIDPDKNYNKENCRWATAKEQAETNRGCFKKGQIPWNKGVAAK